MAVTFGTFGTVAQGTTSATPAYASPTAGQALLLFLSWGNSTDVAPSAPAGWTMVSPGALGGAGAYGVDTGNRGSSVWRRDTDATGSEGTGTITVTNPGDATSVISAVIFTLNYTLTALTLLSVAASDTSSGTAYSATGTAGSVGTVNGDHLLAATSWVPDTATVASPAIAWTGSGSGQTFRGGGANSNGNDIRMLLYSRDATGTSSGDPSFTATMGAAGAGATLFVVAHDGTASGATAPLTDTITSAGVVGAVVGAALALTCAVTASGVVGTSSGAIVNEAATIAAAGSVAGGSPSSGATLSLTDTITTAGQVGTSSGASRAETATIAAAGQVGTSSSATRAETVTLTAAGLVGANSTATRSETATLTAAGQVGTISAASLAPVVTITATGTVARSSTATATYTVSITAAGSVSSGGPVVPYVELTAPARANTLAAPAMVRKIPASAVARTLVAAEVHRKLTAPAVDHTLEAPEKEV